METTRAYVPAWLRRRWPAMGRGGDEGSGTMAGVALIAVCAVMLTMLASMGTLVIAQSRVRTGADLAALSAATVAWFDQGDACMVAQTVAVDHGGRMLRCESDEEDFIVEVAIHTGIPLFGELSSVARAGPEQCS